MGKPGHHLDADPRQLGGNGLQGAAVAPPRKVRRIEPIDNADRPILLEGLGHQHLGGSTMKPTQSRRQTRRVPTIPALLLAIAVIAAACTSGNSTQAGSDTVATQPDTTLRSSAPVTTATETTVASTPPPTEAPSTTEAQAPATPSTTSPGEAVSGGPDFVLINPGAEPRELLRYTVDATTRPHSVTETQVIVQDIEGLPDLQRIATSLITDFEAQIIPDTSGPGTYDIVTSPSNIRAVDEADAVSVETANILRAPFTQLETRVTVNDRGVKLAASTTGTEALVAMGPEFESIVDDLTTLEMGAVPLPDTAVGVGARWNVTTDLKVSGFRVIQTVTYEITELEGTTVVLSISGSQISNSQSVPAPGQPGFEISVEKWDMTVSGSATVELDQLINQVTQEATGSQTLIISRGAIETRVEQTIDTGVIVTPS